MKTLISQKFKFFFLFLFFECGMNGNACWSPMRELHFFQSLIQKVSGSHDALYFIHGRKSFRSQSDAAVPSACPEELQWRGRGRVSLSHSPSFLSLMPMLSYLGDRDRWRLEPVTPSRAPVDWGTSMTCDHCAVAEKSTLAWTLLLLQFLHKCHLRLIQELPILASWLPRCQDGPQKEKEKKYLKAKFLTTAVLAKAIPHYSTFNCDLLFKAKRREISESSALSSARAFKWKLAL